MDADLYRQIATDAVLFVALFAILGVRLWYKANVPPVRDSYNYKQEEKTWVTMTIMDQFRRKRT